MSSTLIRISAPGRVCLFGEHQDYLGLPVIAAAISLRVTIEGTPRSDKTMFVRLPDIGSQESFLLNEELQYTQERDYFKSGVRVLRRHGFQFSKGYDCVVEGEIPINAGTSSSSALVVAWIHFLAQIADNRAELPPQDIALYAHEAEVLEFSEPGGMMDHYSISTGGVVFLEFFPAVSVARLDAPPGSFVLGNSHQPKETKTILARVKHGVLDTVRTIQEQHPEFSMQTARAEEISRFKSVLSSHQIELLRATITNRDITREARSLLQSQPVNKRGVGELLSQHQAILRDVLQISTPKIDTMIEAALEAGAYGAKINGSGGGGCMFAYAPERTELVADAIERIGEATIMSIDRGTQRE